MSRVISVEDALKRVDGVLAKADQVLAAVTGDYSSVRGADVQAFRSAGLALLDDYYGTDHVKYTDFKYWVGGADAYGSTKGRAIIQVVREEVADGLLTKTRSLIAAEVFGDLLEMADYFLGEQHKLPAAVLDNME